MGKAVPRLPTGWVYLAALVSLAADSSALAEDRVPPSPDKPWYPSQLRQYETHLARGGFAETRNTVEIDPAKDYDLPELIDIAERTNPQTRIAWERARQAAAAVGLSQSAYFPYLVASAGAGYERAFMPFPTLQKEPGSSDVTVTGGGTLITDFVADIGM